MATRTRLTLDRIAKATCPADKKQSFLWDTESPRLAVRTTSNGAKSFIYEGKLNRSTIRRTIGSTSAWRLDDARAEANRLQTLIDRGIDPRELDKEKEELKAAEKVKNEEAKREAERRKKYTLRALCSEYISLLEDQNKTSGTINTAKSAFKLHIFAAFPELADQSAREITAHQLAEVIRRLTTQGKERMAGTLRSYLSAAYNVAKRAPFDSRLPGSLIPFEIEQNPVDPLAAIPVKAGKRHLNKDELKIYIQSLGDSLVDQTLKFALYSGGQRPAQLTRAKVSDYEPEEKILRLLDSKGRRREPREHFIPLSSVSADIIEALVEQAQQENRKLIFASCRGAVHSATLGIRVSEISGTMKGEPFTMRDIRRTCETMLAGLGISKDIRAQLLSHGVSGVQAIHYDRYLYVKEKRTALRKWEQHLTSILSRNNKAKVIKLR